MENVTEFLNKTLILSIDMAGIFISNEFSNVFLSLKILVKGQ